MKKLLLFLVLSVSTLYGMEEGRRSCKRKRPEVEQSTAFTSVKLEKNEISESHTLEVWQLLGNQEVPDLKFIAALQFTQLDNASLACLDIPEELAMYVQNLKKQMGSKLLALLLQTQWSKQDRAHMRMLVNLGADLDEQDQHVEEQHNQINENSESQLWQLLGNSGVPDLQFITTLPFIQLENANLAALNIPEELISKIQKLKKQMQNKLLSFFYQESDDEIEYTQEDQENIKLLINSGAGINLTLDFGNKTSDVCVLHAAAERGLKDIVSFLIQRGVSLDQVVYDHTALHCVLYCQDKKTALIISQLLIKAGADLDLQATAGFSSLTSPLMSAVNSLDQEIAAFFILSGADLDIQNSEGDTALHLAVLMGMPEIVTLLIESGADVTLKNRNEQTALDLAKSLFQQAVTANAHDARQGNAFGQYFHDAEDYLHIIALFDENYREHPDWMYRMSLVAKLNNQSLFGQ